jgi:hypothetical protein
MVMVGSVDSKVSKSMDTGRGRACREVEDAFDPDVDGRCDMADLDPHTVKQQKKQSEGVIWPS